MPKRKREEKEPNDTCEFIHAANDVQPWNLRRCRRNIFRGPHRWSGGTYFAYVFSVDYNEELKLIVEGTRGNNVRCFDEETGEMKWDVECVGHQVAVKLVGHKRDQVFCCTTNSYDDGAAMLLKLSTGEVIWRLEAKIRAHTRVRTLDKFMAFIEQFQNGKQFNIVVIDIAQGNLQATIHFGRTCPIFIDSHFVYAQLDCIRIWKIDGTYVCDLPFHGTPLEGVMQVADEKIIYVTKERELMITNASTKELHKMILPPLLFDRKDDFFIDFDGKNILLYSWSGVWLWDMTTEPKTIPMEHGIVTSLPALYPTPCPVPMCCVLEGDIALVVDTERCHLFHVRTGQLVACIPENIQPRITTRGLGWKHQCVCLRGQTVVLGCDLDMTRMYTLGKAMPRGTRVWARSGRSGSHFWLPARVETPPVSERSREEDVFVYIYGKQISMWVKNTPVFVVPFDELPTHYFDSIYIPKTPKDKKLFQDAVLEAGWTVPRSDKFAI